MNIIAQLSRIVNSFTKKSGTFLILRQFDAELSAFDIASSPVMWYNIVYTENEKICKGDARWTLLFWRMLARKRLTVL